MAYLDNFNYKISGPATGRRWVFLHGLMGYGQNWARITSALEVTEQCLVYDQRGHGKSFQPQDGYAPEDYADDLKLILDELGWEKIILVGHSMGGRNVLNFASRFPDYVEKLVIEDIGPEAMEGAHLYYEELLNVVPTPFANREVARDFFKVEFPKLAKTREKVEVLAGYFYSNMTEKPDGTLDWRFSKHGIIDSVKAGRNKDRWKEVAGLSMPTLIIRGENSPELSRENYHRMLDSNRMLRGVEIPQAAHWVHADQPQVFVETIKEFVGGF
jgi:Predicted hydrolases or acyltransferases (alpha/beta hydrolase superfamily)